MNIEIVRDENNKPIGWEMSGENKEELNKLCIIRDLQFWGYGVTSIKYAGRTESDDANNNPGKLTWRQKG